MQIHKLGKNAPREDSRTLKFAKYRVGLAPVVPVVGAEVSWITKVPPPWNMFLNDTLGDCVCAGMAHMVMQWSFYAGKPFIPTNDDVLRVYEDVGGYKPGDPSTDNGCDMLTALQYWKDTGIAGHKIDAYMTVDWTSDLEIREAIRLFGSVFVGLALPNTAQGQDSWTVADGGIYTPNGEPGSWGGHCVPFMAASPETRTCVTWGATLKQSHNFDLDYVDEMYVVLSPDWIAANGVSASQFNLTQLQADLAAL